MSNTSTPPRTPRVPRQPQERGAAAAAGGAKQAGGGGASNEPAEPVKGRNKKKLLIIGVVLALVAAGAVYFLVIAPKKANATPPAPKPGTVAALESTSVNLANGHYLRIGVALQMTTAASGGHGSDGPDGSKAKDLIISTFSGQKQETLANAGEREKLKSELREAIKKAYDDEVMDIYFTEFVTQ